MSTTIINNTTTTNIKAKKISQLDALDKAGMKSLADYLYLPVAYVDGTEANTNYKIPLSIILNMINDCGCKCVENLEKRFLELLAANVDYTWHTIDKLPKQISLGIDEDTKKIKIRLSGGSPEPVVTTYKVVLTINTPIDSKVGVSAYHKTDSEEILLKDFYLTTNVLELEVDEGIELAFNTYWLYNYIKSCYPDNAFTLTDVNSKGEHEITPDTENLVAWTSTLQIYKDEEIVMNLAINPYITFNDGGANGAKEFVINGTTIAVADIGKQYINYDEDTILQCVTYDNYYVDGDDTITLTKDNLNHKFTIYQKPYAKFYIVAFNGEVYDGTSKCSILPQSLINDIQKLNGYYNVNTKIDSIVTPTIQSQLKYGGFYSLYSPLYYEKDTLNIINELNKDSKDIDIVLKQNTSTVNINIVDEDHIETTQKLPLKRVINYETLFSTESPWDTSSITCTIDPEVCEWDIKYTNSTGKSSKGVLTEIIETSQSDKEFIFKFKESPSKLPTTSDKYSNFCSYNDVYTISIGTKLIPKYYYYAGWECPSNLSELAAKAKTPNGGAVKSLDGYNANNPLRNYIADPISYDSKSRYYVVIPTSVSIYDSLNNDMSNVAFAKYTDVIIEGYNIYYSNVGTRNINAIKLF